MVKVKFNKIPESTDKIKHLTDMFKDVDIKGIKTITIYDNECSNNLFLNNKKSNINLCFLDVHTIRNLIKDVSVKEAPDITFIDSNDRTFNLFVKSEYEFLSPIRYFNFDRDKAYLNSKLKSIGNANLSYPIMCLLNNTFITCLRLDYDKKIFSDNSDYEDIINIFTSLIKDNVNSNNSDFNIKEYMVNSLSDHLKIRCDVIEHSVNDINKNINDKLKEICSLQSELKQLKILKRSLDFNLSDFEEEALNLINKLESNKDINKFDISNDKLTITTNPIYLKRLFNDLPNATNKGLISIPDNVKIPLGRFKIIINFCEHSKLVVKNLDSNYSNVVHPHITASDFCYGSLKGLLKNLAYAQYNVFIPAFISTFLKQCTLWDAYNKIPRMVLSLKYDFFKSVNLDKEECLINLNEFLESINVTGVFDSIKSLESWSMNERELRQYDKDLLYELFGIEFLRPSEDF